MQKMTDEEFYKIYGRLPVKNTTRRKKVKVYWGRIIVALIILIFLICGLCQLIGSIIKHFRSNDVKSVNVGDSSDSVIAVKDDKSSSQSDESSSEVSSDTKDESSLSDDEKETKKYQFKVCIDPGHGGEDAGSLSLDGKRLEKEDTLKISLAVKKYLSDKGVNVIMTHEDDRMVDLEDICKFANNGQSDLFVSIHRNKTEDVKTCGVEIWIQNMKPKCDETLASNILKNLEKVGISANRGVKSGFAGIPTDNYQVNADTAMPSCLCELGFISSDQDNKLWDDNFNKYVEAIGNGIIDTAIELKVVDDNGKRILNGQLLSEEKIEVNPVLSGYKSKLTNKTEQQSITSASTTVQTTKQQ